MKLKLISLAIATTLCTSVTSVGHAHAPASPAVPAAHADGTAQFDDVSGNKKPVTLNVVTVTGKLNRARNSLSPETGSSQYVIDRKAIAQLPLGAATPLNQVILQAPGVVQDSFGQLHVRGDHANLQYRINGVILPESIAGFGQTLDARTIQSVKLLDGALPAQFGERTAAVVAITTRSGQQLGNGGSIGVTGGSFGTFNPHVSWWGGQGRWSWFLTANYLQNDVGIQNPTPSRNPIHDHTNQLKAFGDLSYLVNDNTRLSFLFGMANNRFEIPNNPGQEPEYGYLGLTQFKSANLNERQHENTRFGTLSLQGTLGSTDYQVSLGQRYRGSTGIRVKNSQIRPNWLFARLLRAHVAAESFPKAWDGVRQGSGVMFDAAK